MNKLSKFAFVIAIAFTSVFVWNSVKSTTAQAPVKNNLVGLVFLKHDNLKQQYRAEFFPIALYKNGRYQNASLDVTLQVRKNSTESAIVKANAAKTVLKPIQTLKLLNPPQQFTLESLGVGQFACSSLLIGRGNVQGNIAAVFDAMNPAGGAQGYLNRKQVDETWRSTIAAQQGTFTPIQSTGQYTQDVLAAANKIFTTDQTIRSITGQTTIETQQTTDLDRDGKPEVFAVVRKGLNPKTDSIPPTRTPQSAYVTLWLSYKANSPKVISSNSIAYNAIESRRPSELVGAIDINGDGIAEVIMKDNGYESSTFSIHEYKRNQLRSVFSGAGYGC